MEIFLSALVIFPVLYFLYREIKKAHARLEICIKNQFAIDNSLACDIESIEKALVVISEKIHNMPYKIQEDVSRSLLVFRDSLDSTKPIKPNNWNSVKEAFKGPTRATIDERD